MSDAQTYRNIGDAEQVQKQKQNVKREREALLNDFRAVLGTRQGRNVLASVLRSTGHDLPSVSESGSRTYFNEGSRKVGLELLAVIKEADRKAWIQMELEQGETDV